MFIENRYILRHIGGKSKTQPRAKSYRTAMSPGEFACPHQTLLIFTFTFRHGHVVRFRRRRRLLNFLTRTRAQGRGISCIIKIVL